MTWATIELISAGENPMAMKRKKSKAAIPAHLTAQLSDLESKASAMGLTVHYDLMEAAGLKLNGGLCRIKGQYHLFIDRRASAAERIAMIKEFLQRPLDLQVQETGEEIDNQGENIHGRQQIHRKNSI